MAWQYAQQPLIMAHTNLSCFMFKNLDISAEKTQLVPGWTTEESGLNLWQEQVIFLAHSIHTGTGAHPVSCLMGMGGFHWG